MAAKFFTGLPLDGPDPECVVGYGAHALAGEREKPRPSGDHSRKTGRGATAAGPATSGPVPLTLSRRAERRELHPVRPCNESPV